MIRERILEHFEVIEKLSEEIKKLDAENIATEQKAEGEDVEKAREHFAKSVLISTMSQDLSFRAVRLAESIILSELLKVKLDISKDLLDKMEGYINQFRILFSTTEKGELVSLGDKNIKEEIYAKAKTIPGTSDLFKDYFSNIKKLRYEKN